MSEFKPFPSIARLSREMVVTEKLDGTNASIFIGEDGSFLTGSRTRWITPTDDNFGFSAWAHAHRDELVAGLGVGTHFGEWWGQGIQRKYGLTEKRFSLFNVSHWNQDTPPPACCSVVPILHIGTFNTEHIIEAMHSLAIHGSHAVPGFMKPEGVVVYHRQGNFLFKKTFEKDDTGKGFGA